MACGLCMLGRGRVERSSWGRLACDTLMRVSSCSRRQTFSSICPPSLAISISHEPLKIVPG